MTAPDLIAEIEAMPAAEHKGALWALDQLSRPLNPREIERALRARGVDRSRSTLIAGCVKRFGIIPVVGGEP